MSESQVTDAGVAALARLPLAALDLSRSRASVAALRRLARAKGLRALMPEKPKAGLGRGGATHGTAG